MIAFSYIGDYRLLGKRLEVGLGSTIMQRD